MTHEPDNRQDAASSDPLADLEEQGFLVEFWDFMRVRKKFWLAPIILALLLLGFLFYLAVQAPVVAPFIYAM